MASDVVRTSAATRCQRCYRPESRLRQLPVTRELSAVRGMALGPILRVARNIYDVTLEPGAERIFQFVRLRQPTSSRTLVLVDYRGRDDR